MMYNATTMSESWLNSDSISPDIPRRRGFLRSKVCVVDEWEQMKRDFKKKSESLSEPSDSISDDEDNNKRRRLAPDRWDNCWNCCAVVDEDEDEDDEEIEYTKIPGEMQDWKEEEDVESDRNVKSKSKNRKDVQSHFDKLKLRFTRTDSPELPRYVDRSEPKSQVKSGEDFRSQEHIWTGSSDLDFVY